MIQSQFNAQKQKFTFVVQQHFAESAQVEILAALDYACLLHKDQHYGCEPYAYHLVSVALNLVTLFDCRDKELVIAALLHDSLEDQAERILSLAGAEGGTYEGMAAFSILEAKFGTTCARLVELLSFDPSDGASDTEDILKNYFKHLRNLVRQEPKAALLKLSDGSTNWLSILEVKSSSKRSWYYRKYAPVMSFVADYLEELRNEDNPLFAAKKWFLPELRKALKAYSEAGL